MAKLNIIYYSGTGNTEQIASYIEEGAKDSGVEVEKIEVSSADESSLDADFIALGSPATGAEEVAPEMVDYVDSVKNKLEGKTVGLFGSNDWGTGEFLETWKEELEGLGAKVVGDGLVINLAPDDDDKIEASKNYGKTIVG
ncbi:MAG: flavodoxin [Leptotrichiaceae bacterium]|nr:flavodoxin [Leptotrichiaceae bacterium]MBP6281987.1 flavodoxin [Leptotrichiaceae bacterium]MBP7100992.1 flavodoxin [Leptotrichiaceae bacterium]MBP7725583.1 flavodoxin [Leptotrichiaceae bacterium]MBP9630074.1 flavodoxin [Leptotrichiaceae bacterium]